MTKVVVALGGNALLRRGETPDAATQLANVKAATASLAGLADHHDLVITHGNGPQVGLLALQGEANGAGRPNPLDVLDAETAGMTGYLLEQELANRLPGRDVVTLLTRVEVDPADPAFSAPSKPIGPVYTAVEAADLAAARGWTMSADGAGWRRTVPSPTPGRIHGLHAIRLLMEDAVIVICAGGGGIPVASVDGQLHGIEAVIDKDRTSALLAAELGADVLLLLTDVDGVVDGWGTDRARTIRCAGAEAIEALPLPPGSMGPKAEAAAWFARRGGRAAIGTLSSAEAVLAGRSGTTIVGDGPIRYRRRRRAGRGQPATTRRGA